MIFFVKLRLRQFLDYHQNIVTTSYSLNSVFSGLGWLKYQQGHFFQLMLMNIIVSGHFHAYFKTGQSVTRSE